MIGQAGLRGLVAARSGSPSSWPLRWRVARRIATREVRDALFGWSLYVAAALALLVGALPMVAAERAVAESGLQIVSRPLHLPLLVATALAALYLAGWAALSIARPREQGALRVLFFAPVDAAGLIAAQALAALAAYVVFLLLTAPLTALLALLLNVPVPTQLLVGLLVSPALAAPAIAIGLLISAAAPSARAAALLLVLTLLGLLAIEAGYGALLQIPATERYYDALRFLRDLLRVARDALGWVSPLALLSDGLDAAGRASWRELGRLAATGIVGSAVWLALAAWALRRKGVLP